MGFRVRLAFSRMSDADAVQVTDFGFSLYNSRQATIVSMTQTAQMALSNEARLCVTLDYCARNYRGLHPRHASMAVVAVGINEKSRELPAVAMNWREPLLDLRHRHSEPFVIDNDAQNRAGHDARRRRWFAVRRRSPGRRAGLVAIGPSGYDATRSP